MPIAPTDENSKDDDIIFVNLQENRESYTAYNGSNIWNAIYQENCMLERIHQIPTVFGVNPLELCTEDTLLYHIISGLHSSVNMHISANYYDMESNKTYANHSMFYEKLGKYPDRIANMHFTYALVVRAINRVHDQLI